MTLRDERRSYEEFHLIVTHEPVISKFIESSGENFPNGSDQYVKGFYFMNGMETDTSTQMYVSSGIGLTKYPFRFLNIPEIIVINLIRLAEAEVL